MNSIKCAWNQSETRREREIKWKTWSDVTTCSVYSIISANGEQSMRILCRIFVFVLHKIDDGNAHHTRYSSRKMPMTVWCSHSVRPPTQPCAWSFDSMYANNNRNWLNSTLIWKLWFYSRAHWCGYTDCSLYVCVCEDCGVFISVNHNKFSSTFQFDIERCQNQKHFFS